MISALLKSSQATLLALFFTAAFIISLFFGGYQDIIYAPAIGMLLLAALSALLCFKRREISFPVAPPALMLFGFWMFVTLSLTWSHVPFASLVTWLIFLSTPLAFLSFATVPRREVAIKTAAMLVTICFCCLSVYALYQFTTPGGSFQGRAHNPLPNPNSLGGLLAMAVPPLTALYFARKDKISHAALAASLLIMAGTFATGSRGAILALMIALFVQFLMVRPAKLGIRPARKWLPLVVASVLIFGAINSTGRVAVTGRLAGLMQPMQEEEVIHRVALWESAIEMIKDAPLLGSGLGTFYLAYPPYRSPFDRSLGNWVHMDPLQFAVEMGIGAPILFYLFLGTVLVFTIRALKKTERDSPLRYSIAGSFCGLLVIALHSHATFHLYIMPILLCCGLLLAIWYSFTEKALTDKNFLYPLSLQGARKIAFNLTVVIALISVALVTASAAAGSYFTLTARQAIIRNDISTFADHIEKAQRYGPVGFIDPNVQAAGFYADIAHTSLYLNSPEEQREMVRNVETLLNEAALYNPYWAEIDYKRGVFYNKLAEDIVPEARILAEASFKKALEKDPMHYRTREKLAEFYISRGRIQKAFMLMNDALKYPTPQDYYDKFWVMRKQLEPLAKIQTQFEFKQEKDAQTDE